MRILVILFLTLGHWVSAQIQLNGVTVNIESLQNGYEVTTFYEIELDNETEVLSLKALMFGRATISQIQLEGIDPIITLDKKLTTIRIPVADIQDPKKLTLKYLATPGDRGEVPIFFGSWESASSDQDFFRLTLNANLETNLLFPADSETEISGKLKVITTDLPAAASMIRLEQGSDAGAVLIRRVDQMVMLIYIVIGALIWLNRKRLIYG